jgi:hypothetical protein
MITQIRGEAVYSPEDFDKWDLIKRFPISRGGKRRYYECIITFDIETTRLEEIEQSVMYIWQMDLNGYVIVGRTWDEFKAFLERLCEGVKDGLYWVIYVHNFSYEFSFLRGILNFEPDDVFLTSPRRILYARWNHIEFRCSYMLTNMSLAEFTRKMGVEYQKVEGFDYNKKRFPWTPLTDFEMEYIVGDVVGLSQAIAKTLKMDHDDIKSVPYTSTGYVRRDLKKAMSTYPRIALRKMQPDLYIYEMLREAFRGGNCHANRYYTGQILENVHSIDRSSSYPDCQVNDLFPMGPWHLESKNLSIEFVLRMIRNQKRCFVARVALRNVRLKDKGFGCPYLTRDKSRSIICQGKTADGQRKSDYMYDNGRILFADYLETTITDIDLKIIMMQYDFDDITFLDLAHCRYGRLPIEWRDSNVQYYINKTRLKGNKEEDPEGIFYAKMKALLNAIYGDTVQDPGKITIKYTGNDELPFVADGTPLEVKLAESQKHTYKNYAWGVWCTAWARYRLEEMIQMAHHAYDPETGEEFNGYVYSDTDSVKYLGIIPGVDDYNMERIHNSMQNNGYADDVHGIRHYMGVYEDEGTYDRFITWGAKKYAYEINGSLHITLSGVAKSGAAELKSLEDFRPGFVFHDAAGLETLYNDTDYGEYEVDGHTLHITKNTVLRPTFYKMGLAQDYERILSDPEIYLYIFDAAYYNVV